MAAGLLAMLVSAASGAARGYSRSRARDEDRRRYDQDYELRRQHIDALTGGQQAKNYQMEFGQPQVNPKTGVTHYLPPPPPPRIAGDTQPYAGPLAPGMDPSFRMQIPQASLAARAGIQAQQQTRASPSAVQGELRTAINTPLPRAPGSAEAGPAQPVPQVDQEKFDALRNAFNAAVDPRGIKTAIQSMPVSRGVRGEMTTRFSGMEPASADYALKSGLANTALRHLLAKTRAEAEAQKMREFGGKSQIEIQKLRTTRAAEQAYSDTQAGHPEKVPPGVQPMPPAQVRQVPLEMLGPRSEPKITQNNIEALAARAQKLHGRLETVEQFMLGWDLLNKQTGRRLPLGDAARELRVSDHDFLMDVQREIDKHAVGPQ